MNRVALISNGPSARLFEQVTPDIYDTVIGAGKAVSLYRCHWWAFADWQTFRDCKPAEPIGNMRIMTRENIPDKIQMHAEPAIIDRWQQSYWQNQKGSNVIFTENVDIPGNVQYKESWFVFSGLIGLGCAYHLKPCHIDVYGVELAGESDFEGINKEDNRKSDRWEYERRIWNYLVQCIEYQGITVQRITDGRFG